MKFGLKKCGRIARIMGALAGIALAMSTSLAKAEVLVHFDNPVSPPRPCCFDSAQPQPMQYINPRLTASDVTSTGVLGVPHVEAYQTNGWGRSLDESKFISFSVAPTAGLQARFTSFDIDIWQTSSLSQGAFALRSSQNGFSTNLLSSLISHVDSNPANSSYHFELDNLQPTLSSMEFRLYFYGNSDHYILSMGGMGDGFTLSGEVAAPVPTPQSYALMLAGLGVFGAVVRRRKASACARGL